MCFLVRVQVYTVCVSVQMGVFYTINAYGFNGNSVFGPVLHIFHSQPEFDLFIVCIPWFTYFLIK